MKRNLLITILIILAVAYGFYVYDQNNKQVLAPSDSSPAEESRQPSGQVQQQQATTTREAKSTTTPTAENKTASAPTQESQGQWSSGSEVEGMAPDILVTEVVYNGTDFTPNNLNIKVGDVVIFRNNGGASFWPASAPHPQHTDYPEFDANKTIAAGGKWQFTFEKAGTWKFHDHLNPSARGTVTVSSR